MKSDEKQYLIIMLIIIILLLLHVNGRMIRRKKQKKQQPIEKTTNNQQPISKEEKTIVLYYANWCGHSRAFIPEWEKFEKYCQQNINDINVIKMLCEGDNAKNCKGIRGYPTVILINNGKAVTYKGDRTMESLIEFVNAN